MLDLLATTPESMPTRVCRHVVTQMGALWLKDQSITPTTNSIWPHYLACLFFWSVPGSRSSQPSTSVVKSASHGAGGNVSPSRRLLGALSLWLKKRYSLRRCRFFELPGYSIVHEQTANSPNPKDGRFPRGKDLSETWRKARRCLGSWVACRRDPPLLEFSCQNSARIFILWCRQGWGCIPGVKRLPYNARRRHS